jgi:hypothetical protein
MFCSNGKRSIGAHENFSLGFLFDRLNNLNKLLEG